MGPNGLPSYVSHLFIGDVVSVGDAEELSEALISMACILLSVLLLVSKTHRRTGIWT